MKRSTLLLFTAEFPFGYAEAFIENELIILSQRFEKIILVPSDNANKIQRKLPDNVTITDVIEKRKSFSSSKLFARNVFLIIKILCTEYFHCSNKLFFIKKGRYFNAVLLKAINDAKLIDKCIKDANEKVILYSFWMNDWALALSILKEKRMIDKFVFSCGGFDIYDERHEGNYLPFRYFIYKNTSGIYPNSMIGESYIKAKNMFPEKVSVQYLATTDYGTNPFVNNSVFTIVSCSRLVPLKRVELIIEILKQLDFEVKWIHFGDGELFYKIKKLAESLPPNIRYVFKGNVTNTEVINFYKTNTVNLFITTSETEGLPVSIQEAISFGIPTVATNVGGMPEVVNEQTGWLIEKDFNPQSVAVEIKEFKNGIKNSTEFRNKVRQYWMNKFEAGRVYNLFCDQVLT